MFSSMKLDIQQLVQLVHAESLDQLEGVCSAFTFLDMNEASSAHSEASTCTSRSEYTDLLAKAAANIMRLHLQERGRCLLSNCSSASANILIALWGLIKLTYRKNAIERTPKQRQEAVDHRICATMTGAACELVQTLISYTQSYVKDISSLTPSSAAISAASSASTTDKQLAEQLSRAFRMLNQLLQVWVAVCLQLSSEPSGYQLFPKAATAVTNLATQALPLLQVAIASAHANSEGSGGSCSSILAGISTAACTAANTVSVLGCVVAASIARLFSQRTTSGHQGELEQPALHEMLLTDGMLELLLMSLAQQAGCLQALSVSAPAWMRSAHTPDTCTGSAAPDHQQHANWRSEHRVLLNSHLVLLKTLNICCFEGDSSRWGSRAVSGGILSAADPASANVTGKQSTSSNHSKHSEYLIKALSAVVSHRLKTAHISNSSSHGTQQQGAELCSSTVFQGHLVMPTLKVLIQLLLLLQAEDISALAACQELMLLLLTLPRAATIPPKHDDTRVHASEAGQSLFPVLQKAVAARLLHPVVQLLSRVTMQALKGNQPDAYQQQQEADMSTSPRSQKMHLVGLYGRLLIAVCQAVEPKHIAAALGKDPLVPLAAAEAVIRAWACQLAPASCQQQLHQADDTMGSNLTSRLTQALGSDCSVAAHRQHNDLLARLLNPVAWKYMSAVELIMKHQPSMSDCIVKSKCGAKTLLLSRASLLERIFSFTSTLCKLGQVTAQEHAGQPSWIIAHEVLGEREWYSVIDDTAVSHNTRNGTLQLLLSGAEPVHHVAAALYEYTVVLDLFGVECANVCTGVAVPRLNDCACSIASKGQQRTSKGDVSSSLQPMRLWGLAAVAFLRVLHGVVQQLLAKHQSTVSFITLLSENEAELSPSQHPSFFASMHKQIADDMSEALHEVKGMLSGPVTEALQLTTQWKPTQLQLEHVHLKGCVSNGRVTACQQQQQQCRQQQLKTLADLRQSAADVKSKCLQLGKKCQSRDYLHKHAHVLHNVLESAKTLYLQLSDFTTSIQAQFPVSFCCNNPCCLHLCKLSEYQLVSGKACVCGGCKVARYCSRDCQRKHWKQHKQTCRQMQLITSEKEATGL